MTEGTKIKKKSRKFGRNRAWCQAYRLRDQRGINKALRLTKHLLRFPDDQCATDALERIERSSRRRAMKAAA